MRALNGVLDNKVNADLIPGAFLRELIQHYPAFEGTIYMQNPSMIYTSGKVQFVTLNRDKLFLEAIVHLPRIMMSEFGSLYHQYSCQWEHNNTYVKISGNHKAIQHGNTSKWYNTNGCIETEDVMLCNIKEIGPVQDNCFDVGTDWNLGSCPLSQSV